MAFSYECADLNDAIIMDRSKHSASLGDEVE